MTIMPTCRSCGADAGVHHRQMSGCWQWEYRCYRCEAMYQAAVEIREALRQHQARDRWIAEEAEREATLAANWSVGPFLTPRPQ